MTEEQEELLVKQLTQPNEFTRIEIDKIETRIENKYKEIVEITIKLIAIDSNKLIRESILVFERDVENSSIYAFNFRGTKVQ